MVLTIVTDYILIRHEFVLVLILASRKVARFHNEVPTFLYQKHEALIF